MYEFLQEHIFEAPGCFCFCHGLCRYFRIVADKLSICPKVSRLEALTNITRQCRMRDKRGEEERLEDSRNSKSIGQLDKKLSCK